MTEHRDESQTGWGKVVVGSCHITSTLKVTLWQLFLSSDANSTERGICWRGTLKRTWNGNPKMGTLNGNLEWEPWMGTLNGNLMKKFPNQWNRLRKKVGRPLRTFKPRREADESQKIMSLGKNLLSNDGKTEEENWTRDQLMKNFPTDERDGEENRKIIKYW